MKVPHRRPQQLSDPFHDHSTERLATLIAKPDEELNWMDYQCLLGPYLPAGTYEQSVYFLPLAIDYLKQHDDEALDLITPIIGFASEYALQLKDDRILDAVRFEIQSCLNYWTADFVVRHYGQDECRQKGWTVKYGDLVRHSEVVTEAISDCVRFEAHTDLMTSWLAQIASLESSAVQSAWFLECTRRHLADDVYQPPEHPQMTPLLEDNCLAVQHFAKVSESLPGFDSSSTYWRDMTLLLDAET